MLLWALMFLIITIVAWLFGFEGIAVEAAGVATILFFIFLVIWLVSLLARRWAWEGCGGVNSTGYKPVSGPTEPQPFEAANRTDTEVIR